MAKISDILRERTYPYAFQEIVSLYAEVRVQLPPKLNEEQKRLFTAFANSLEDGHKHPGA